MSNNCHSTLAVEAVLSHKHDKLSKSAFLARCVDLTLAEDPSYSIVPVVNHSKKVVSHKPFSIKVEQHYMPSLKFYHQDIDKQFSTLHATMQLDEGQCELHIVPCQENTSIKDWGSRCKSVVETFTRNLTVETLNISADKQDIMHPVIDKSIQQENALHIDYTHGTITIAGEQGDVNRVKEALNKSYQAIVSETIPIKDEKFFLLLTAKLKYETHPLEVKASTNANDHSVTIMGFEEKCKQFKSDIDNQMTHVHCVPVLSNDQFNQFLCTETGKILLKYYLQPFRSEVVTYFEKSGDLFILGTTESQASINKSIQTIQSGLCCFQIACPPSAEKFLQDKEWLEFCMKLESKQFVQIKIAKHHIKVIGDTRLGEPVKEQIEKFIDSKCPPMKQFKLCNAQWRLVHTYLLKKWQKLEKELQREKQIQLVVPDLHDEDPIIIVEGGASQVEWAGKKIEQFLSLIVSSTPIRQVRCGIINYFFSEKGKATVQHIETKEHCCIQITIEYDSTSVGETNLFSPKQQALLLQPFAIDSDKVKMTETCLQDLIKNRLFTDKIDDRIISQLTPEQCSTIEQKARARNVDVTIETGKTQHCIDLEGELSDIITLKQEIHSFLHQSDITESMQIDIKSTQAKVKWQWQNKSGIYEDYDALANYDIEQAYQCDQNALFDLHDSKEQFDFQKMEAKNKNDQTVCKIVRSKTKFGKFYICIHIVAYNT